MFVVSAKSAYFKHSSCLLRTKNSLLTAVRSFSPALYKVSFQPWLLLYIEQFPPQENSTIALVTASGCSVETDALA